MADSLKDKIALVTGAGSGIGRATSLVLAREGATIAVSDIDADGGEETLSAIKDMGGDGIFVHADVSRPADVEAMAGRLSRPTDAWTAHTTMPEARAIGAGVSTNTQKAHATASWTST